jgi:NitT/TauT family transport system substrate-binding protein
MNRRAFVAGLTAAGATGLFGLRPHEAAAEPPPETATLRVAQSAAICFAPQYVAGEQLLQAEGFTDLRYIKKSTGWEALSSGEADISAVDAPSLVAELDKGKPIVVLTGLHVGCYELFGTTRVRTIRDLKGKEVAIPGLHSGRHLMLSTMLAHVGLDPRKDVTWVTRPAAESMRLFAEGRIDAYLGFPPEPQELRAKKIGHVVVSTTLDRPWSRYFCCMMVANRDFVRKNPIATKRAVRAILKAAEVCATEPGRVAQLLVDRGFAGHDEYVREMLTELPYSRWAEYHPEDTLRFYALRLHEAGLIKSSPQKVIAQGADWRFLNELKKELKG